MGCPPLHFPRRGDGAMQARPCMPRLVCVCPSQVHGRRRRRLPLVWLPMQTYITSRCRPYRRRGPAATVGVKEGGRGRIRTVVRGICKLGTYQSFKYDVVHACMLVLILKYKKTLLQKTRNAKDSIYPYGPSNRGSIYIYCVCMSKILDPASCGNARLCRMNHSFGHLSTCLGLAFTLLRTCSLPHIQDSCFKLT